MFISELFENDNRQVLVIYPGRFQPPHKGHAEVYKHLCQKYGTDNVFIVTSNKTDPIKSPFDFKEKQLMWSATGVSLDKVVFDAQPYQAKEFVSKFDSANTILIFAISEKDMEEDPRFKFGVKKDGSPSYFQPLKNIDQAKTLDQHGYITTVPTFNFKVLGKPANSATQIRELFAKSDKNTQMKIVTDLFREFNPAVFEIMQEKLLAQDELIDESLKDHSSSTLKAELSRIVKINPKNRSWIDKIRAARIMALLKEKNPAQISTKQMPIGSTPTTSLRGNDMNENANIDNQIFKIQNKYNISREEAAKEYYSGTRVPDEVKNVPVNDLLNPDPKIRSLATAVVKMEQELNNLTGNVNVV